MTADAPTGAIGTKLSVNGREYDLSLPPGETLLATIRERLKLTGSKVGCGRGECGACTVLVDDVPQYACVALTIEVCGPVTTIEGLRDETADLRAAFARHGGLQCGFCTPGQIVHAAALVRRGVDSEETLKRELTGNLCRCTGYTGIVRAVSEVANRRKTEERA